MGEEWGEQGGRELIFNKYLVYINIYFKNLQDLIVCLEHFTLPNEIVLTFPILQWPLWCSLHFKDKGKIRFNYLNCDSFVFSSWIHLNRVYILNWSKSYVKQQLKGSQPTVKNILQKYKLVFYLLWFAPRIQTFLTMLHNKFKTVRQKMIRCIYCP